MSNFQNLKAMENVFNSLTVYGAWQVENEREFNDAEKNAVRNATVVKSDYGKSVMFFMKNGGVTYIPVGRNSVDKVEIGKTYDVNNMRYVRLTKPGESPISRVEINV